MFFIHLRISFNIHKNQMKGVFQAALAPTGAEEGIKLMILFYVNHFYDKTNA